MQLQTSETYIEALDNGHISTVVYGTVDGETWGLISYESQRDAWANVGQKWEACLDDDEYYPCIAQSFYKNWEDAIAANQVNTSTFADNVVFHMTKAEIKERGGLTVVYREFFEEAGKSAPTGEPFYRPIGKKECHW